MAEKIQLVQGDTRPVIVVTLTDKITGEPVDVSDAGTTVVMHFRKFGASTVKDTLIAEKLSGLLLEDGTLSYAEPYAINGKGGRVFFPWNPTTLDTDGEFEGEIEIRYGDNTEHTVFDILKFKVRKEFA